MSFDEVIDRRHAHSLKWDEYGDADVLPLWVADMDFATPGPVIDAITRQLEHGVLGYASVPSALGETLVDRLAGQYGWAIEPEDLVYQNGVVPALNYACRAFCEDGAAIATVTPIYHPFLKAPGYAHLPIVTIPTVPDGQQWRFPLAGFEAAARRTNIGVLLLCNPWNPVGRALTRAELEGIAVICERYDIVICSDEIHCDIVLDDVPHIPIATLSAEVAARTVTLIAPTKTCNIAGIGGGVAVISDPARRARFEAEGKGVMAHIGGLVYAAMLAGYRDCESWRRDLMAYLCGNRERLSEAVAALPGVDVNHVEATYLAWLDVRDLDLADPAGFFVAAGVGLSDGEQFGSPGYVRLNFACPRATLDEALARIRRAVTAPRPPRAAARIT